MRQSQMLACSLVLGLLGGAVAAARQGDEKKEIPAGFAPFEHMVGVWKGAAVPSANRLRGWPEKHVWVWEYVKEVPSGMAIAIEGGKVFSKAL
jgi:hypothetical protein